MSAIATAFAPTADAAAYVPYAGAERALASLEEWVCDAERPVLVLRGPEGAGKSMLLSVLAARVGRHAIPVRVSASGLDPESLARQVLDALGTPWEGTPRVALARAIERLDGRRVLLLLDDADVLAPRTEMWLFDFVRRSAGAVHALLAVRDERLASDLAGAFQSGTTVLPIDAPMTREESEVWLRAALARSGAAGELRARFDPPTVARLHERSGGVPGLLRQEAAGLVSDVTGERPAPAAPAPQPPASHHEEAIVTPAPPSPRREVVPHEPAVREALPRREAVPHELARREAAPPALAEPRLRKAARPLGEREHAARGAAAERAHAGHAAASGD
ncbi:MAG TPA: AAA family ATPase, partial [Myxococcota bacterium]|nr:AAA family ATPase [Myxococcota bacterium]